MLMQYNFIKAEVSQFRAECLLSLYVRFKELSKKAANLDGSTLTNAYRVYLEYERIRKLVEVYRREYQNFLRVEYLSR